MGEPSATGRFGEFGGRFVPETLVPACQELEAAFRDGVGRPGVPRRARRHPARLRRPAVDPHRVPQPRRQARPAPAAQARGPQPHRLAQDQQRARPGAARPADGQDPARRRDRRRPARRRHGDRGRAARAWSARCTWAPSTSSARRSTCSACACSAPRSRPSHSGSRTLKDAVNEAMRDWVATVGDTHYCLGSVMGPHPYPWMVRELHRVIGDEAREQCRALTGGDPDVVVACVGGGSNAAGHLLRLRRHRRPGSSAPSRPAARPSAAACPASSTACAAT